MKRIIPVLFIVLFALCFFACENGTTSKPANETTNESDPVASTIIFADGAAVSRALNSGTYTNIVSGIGDGAVTYSSGTPATATVDASTGAVTLVSVGTTVITANKAATATHSAVSASYTLTVTVTLENLGCSGLWDISIGTSPWVIEITNNFILFGAGMRGEILEFNNDEKWFVMQWIFHPAYTGKLQKWQWDADTVTLFDVYGERDTLIAAKTDTTVSFSTSSVTSRTMTGLKRIHITGDLSADTVSAFNNAIWGVCLYSDTSNLEYGKASVWGSMSGTSLNYELIGIVPDSIDYYLAGFFWSNGTQGIPPDFRGFYNSSDNSEANWQTLSIPVSGTMENIDILCKEFTYTLSYSSTGHTGGNIPSNQIHSGNSTVTVQDGLLRGAVIVDNAIWQRFLGWNTNSGASIAEYVPGDTFTITKDTTLYAIYSTGTAVIRKVGPAGGLIFYDAGSNQSWGRYLEAWKADEPGTHQWKTSDTETTGTATDIGTGHANTYIAMDGIVHPAAEICRNATHGSYSDWFLPSRDELNLMYENLHAGVGYDSVGGFADGPYWSSSEAVNSTDSCAQDFPTGYQGIPDGPNKTSFLRVRAVRAF